ncbi:hypothetical protein RB595_005900 [Gaeumannomyces hyphopodioides]
MQLKSMLASSVALAACAGAAVVPRQDFADVVFSLPEPIPVDNFNERLLLPESVTWSVQEIIDGGGNATEAAPSPGVVARDAALLEARQIGNDDRILQTSTAYPFGAMGRIRINTAGSSSWCSGSLVGPRVVVMARHCLTSGASYRFQPAYYNSERLGGFDVTHSINVPGDNGDNGGCGWKDDWALLIIRTKPNLGYLGFRYMTDAMSDAALNWWNYGYGQDKHSSGQHPYSHNGFRVKKTTGCSSSEGGALEHYADTFGGNSGGPIWLNQDGGAYQYGVHVGAVRGVRAIASHGGTLINAIIKARNDFP